MELTKSLQRLSHFVLLRRLTLHLVLVVEHLVHAIRVRVSPCASLHLRDSQEIMVGCITAWRIKAA